MTGTITYILSRAGYRAMNGPLADERRRLAGAEPPAAYVSYDPRLLAGAGWYGYRIALKGGDRQMVERARYMLSERYVIRDGYEYYADGVYVFGVLLRERVPHYGIGGGAPTPEPEALNFYMPNGGTISLNKYGSPAIVELEYWLAENGQWLIWQPDNNGNRSITLTAGQKLFIRNTSTHYTLFSLSSQSYYTFNANETLYADGFVGSLVCKEVQNARLTRACFNRLFFNNNFLIKSPILHFTTLDGSCYALMFYGCSLLNEIRSYMIDVSAADCLVYWVYNTSPTGDFYCPAELTIPSGSSGIPTGWTRHDI